MISDVSGDPTLADDEVPRGAPAPESLTDPGDGPEPTAPHRRGELLGRYVLLEPIGQGGMGVVYSAYDPELDRRIALKLLHADGSERANARLQREAQAMAKLVHPNVIAVHDVGSFEGGVFVAMELVEGGDLRAWLDAAPRTRAEILEVFLAAGRGLLAAHDAGLVHRDFKPANVLVGREGGVKVVDFGLARRVDDSLDSSGLGDLAAELDLSTSTSGHTSDEGLTLTGALLGTPAYMSPEQHARRTVDARTDQFSFCVALYEALFDQRPFEGGNRVALAMATNRGDLRPLPKGHTVPAPITRALLRGLSPKPRDRFESMAELLAELRYDPSRRRSRLLVGGAVAGLLAVGVYGYARGPAPAPEPCPDPRPMLDDSWSAVQHDALRQAFGGSDLPYADDSAHFVAQRLDRWSETWADARQQACVRTHVRHEQAESVLGLQLACLERQRKDLAAVSSLLLEAAPETIERADRLVASLPAPAACEDGEALGRLPPPPSDEATRLEVESIRDELSEVRALRTGGRYDEAKARARRVRARAEATGYQPVMAELLLLLGNLSNHGSDQVEAERLLHQAAQAAAESRDDELLANAWLELSWNLSMGQSRHEDGMRWSAYAEAIVNRMGRPDWLRANLLCTQGNLAWAERKPQLALERFDACLELRQAQDPDQPEIANTLNYIGNAQIDLGRLEEAEATFRRGIEVSIAAQGPEHPQVAALYNGLGVAQYYLHRLDDAEDSYRRAYEIDRAVLGPEHPDLLFSLGNIANVRRERGELDEALEAMKDVEALVEAAYPPVHREVGMTQHNIAELYTLRGDTEEALRRYDRALEVREQVHGQDSPFVANTLTGRGEVRLTVGRVDDARHDLERALEIREAEEHPRPLDTGRTRFALALALDRQGVEPARAHTLVEQARREYEAAKSPLQQSRREQMDAWLAEHPPPT